MSRKVKPATAWGMLWPNGVLRSRAWRTKAEAERAATTFSDECWAVRVIIRIAPDKTKSRRK